MQDTKTTIGVSFPSLRNNGNGNASKMFDSRQTVAKPSSLVYSGSSVGFLNSNLTPNNT